MQVRSKASYLLQGTTNNKQMWSCNPIIEFVLHSTDVVWVCISIIIQVKNTFAAYLFILFMEYIHSSFQLLHSGIVPLGFLLRCSKMNINFLPTTLMSDSIRTQSLTAILSFDSNISCFIAMVAFPLHINYQLIASIHQNKFSTIHYLSLIFFYYILIK